jgi:hypothetical protein
MRTRTFLQRWSLAVLMTGVVPPTVAANDPAITTVTVRSEQPWTDTGIDVTAGDTVLIQTSGMINVFSGKPEFEQTPIDCLTGNVGPDWAATCGQEAADVIFEVFKHWLKAKPPRPGT